MRRRDFLKSIGAGLPASFWFGSARKAHAAPWGDYPSYALDGALPANRRAKNVLDIFLYGGLCPWETFYVVPEYGTLDNPQFSGQQWWTFQDGPDSVENTFAACYGDAPPPLLQDFRVDENGKLVRLGPFVQPLRARADIVERLRLHVISHTLEPHEAAIPYAMSGFRLGQPRLAGVGAAIQRYYQSRAPVYTGEPYAYVLYSPGDFPTDNLRAASAIGQHPGAARPLAIKVESNTAFIDALGRGTVGSDRTSYDALLKHYEGAYRKRLTWPGGKGAVRAQTLSDYAFALDTLQQTDVLKGILAPDFFTGAPGSSCGENADVNHPHMALKLAAHLLTRPGSQARYVNVVDGGLISASGGGGYDTHDRHIRDSGRNLTNLFKGLVSIINEPGEADPRKLNLDETLVVINTEFGRTPWSQNVTGRNHHPYAYVTAMFGGPVGPEQQGIVGSIDESGYAGNALSPATPRAAILQSLGVFPFAPEGYAVSDVLGATTEAGAGQVLNELILGVKS